ncbi:MAG: hypothetical protein M1831_001751 [Alyxoria varia]|nr:MAG: hypothetical protein M1831_001751 [Alyxoria varia]
MSRSKERHHGVEPSNHVEEKHHKSSKKRKHREDDDDGGVPIANNETKSVKYHLDNHMERKARREGQQPREGIKDDPVANYAAPPEKKLSAKERKKLEKIKNKREKKLPREIRADRKRAKVAEYKANYQRKQVEIAEQRTASRREEAAKRAEMPSFAPPSELAENVKVKEEEPKEPQEPEGPPHPESIAGHLAQGLEVKLPTPLPPPKDSKLMDIPELKPYREPGPNGEPPKKISYKGEKYIRERAKREAKRAVRHWEDVKAHPRDYRPDGTSLTEKDYGVPDQVVKEKKRAERQKTREEKERIDAEKKARKELKEKMKVERRVARKQIRAEKKRQNFEAMQAHISKKIQQKKREKQEKEAQDQGMTYDEYMNEKQRRLEQKCLDRDLRRAEAKDITLEEFRKERDQFLNDRDIEKEARKLGLTKEEYANQPAYPSDSELGSGDEEEQGVKDGTFEHWGRSPIDRIWAKTKAQRKKDAKENGKTDSLNGASENSDSDSHASNSDSESSGSGSDSEASSDEDADKESKDKVKEEEEEKPNVVTGDPFAHSANPTTSSGFIPLDLGDAPDAKPLPFVIDTDGDPSKKPSTRYKQVKELTKEERALRLEMMRQRRAERASADGITRRSKKERRKDRARRKAELIGRMTHDILVRKYQAQEERKRRQEDPEAQRCGYDSQGNALGASDDLEREWRFQAGAPQDQQQGQGGGNNADGGTGAGDGDGGGEEKKDGILTGDDYIKLGGEEGGASMASGSRKKGKGAVKLSIPQPSTMEIRQARRDARRVMRGLKKGKIPEEEVPKGWDKLYGRGHKGKKKWEQKGKGGGGNSKNAGGGGGISGGTDVGMRKLKGNGGREPKRFREGKFKA